MKRFTNIVYIAGSGPNETTAFKRALDLAEDNQAKLTVIGVFDNINILKSSMPIAVDLVDNIVAQKQEDLQNSINKATKEAREIKIEIKVFTGKAFIDIIREVIEFKRDLLIKAIEHPDSFIDTLFGSTDLKLLRKCPCPVWLIKSKAQEGYKEILVGINYEKDNPENEAINLQMLSMAGSLAIAEFSELHIVHAWQFQHEAILLSSRIGYTKSEVDKMIKEQEELRKNWLEDIVERSMRMIGSETSSYLKPQLHLLRGSAEKIVPELAKSIGAELMVMGTVGRSGISGYLVGNTAEMILNQIKCSVLAIKPEGFISPVELKN